MIILFIVILIVLILTAKIVGGEVALSRGPRSRTVFASFDLITGQKKEMDKLDKQISYEYFFHKFLLKVKFFYIEDFLKASIVNWKFLKSFVAMLYEHKCQLDFNKLDNFKEEFFWLFNFYRESISPEFDDKKKYKELIDFLKTEYDKAIVASKKTLSSYTNNVPKLVLYYKGKIDKRLYKEKNILLLHMQYDNLEVLGFYNQCTMRYASEMKLLNKLGFIEMFASPFNRSLDLYCSMFENDKYFGALGTYEEIYKFLYDNPSYFISDMLEEKPSPKDKDKILKLCISPISNHHSQLLILNQCINLLKIRPVIISLRLSVACIIENNVFTKLKYNDFLHDYKFHDFSYNIGTNQYNDMYYNPWMALILSNHKKYNVKVPYIDNILYFPEESPYEIPKLMEKKKVEFAKLF